MQKFGFLSLLIAINLYSQTGSAISFRAYNLVKDGTILNRSVLQINAGDTPTDSFNFWEGNTVSATIRIRDTWPKNAIPLLKIRHRLGFTCNLYREPLAKASYAGPCGMPYQFEPIGTISQISQKNKWTTVTAEPIQASIARFKDFMFPSNAQLEFFLENADSIEIEITDWKTDRISISTPTSEDELIHLELWETRASGELKIVTTDMPQATIQKSITKVGLFPSSSIFDLLGRRITK